MKNNSNNNKNNNNTEYHSNHLPLSQNIDKSGFALGGILKASIDEKKAIPFTRNNWRKLLLR